MEGSDGSWQDEQTLSSNLMMNSTFIVDVIRNWSKTVIKWNLALDQDNGSKIGGGCDTYYGVVTINSSIKAVPRRPLNYSLGQISKFV